MAEPPHNTRDASPKKPGDKPVDREGAPRKSSAPPKPNGPSEDVVVLKDVKKSYGKSEVLKGITMTAQSNTTTVIIGGSGAGKTTLLRTIVALEKPTSGEILIDGENITNMGERELNRVRNKFGMVYQYAALLDSNTVMENVSFPLVEHTKLKKKEIEEKVSEKLKILGLDPKTVATKFPSELSGGMRKRVGLARALMLEPKILIYDEPTSGLDPLTSRMVDDLIEQMREQFGVTSIVISHDIASCFRIAHQAILLIKGEIVARGTPDELAHGDSEIARDFIQKSGVDVSGVSRVEDLEAEGIDNAAAKDPESTDAKGAMKKSAPAAHGKTSVD